VEPQQQEPVKDIQPRATARQRLVAGVFAAVWISAGWDGWHQLQPDFAASHVIGWILVAIAAGYAPAFLYTLLSGRMTRSTRNMLTWAFYNESFSQTRTRIARDQEEVRKRTREM